MKKSEFKSYIKEMIVSELSGVDETTYAGVGAVNDMQKDSNFSKLKDKSAVLNALKAGESVTLEGIDDMDDAEPTAKDIAANSSIAKLKSKYEEVTKQMKAVVNKYKSAEGAEKDKYVAQLKKPLNSTMLKSIRAEKLLLLS